MTAPTDAERARRLVPDICACFMRPDGAPAKWTCRPCHRRDAVVAALAAVRTDERERAARIAETAAASAEGFNDVARNFATNIADAIRRQEGRDA